MVCAKGKRAVEFQTEIHQSAMREICSTIHGNLLHHHHHHHQSPDDEWPFVMFDVMTILCVNLHQNRTLIIDGFEDPAMAAELPGLGPGLTGSGINFFFDFAVDRQRND